MPLLRAIRTVTLLVALLAGWPALAHAHNGHGHDVANAATVAAVTVNGHLAIQPIVAHSASKATALSFVLKSDANSLTAGHISDWRIGSPEGHNDVIARNAAQESCLGGCCCSGVSGCGMSSCCNQFVTTATLTVEFPDSALHFAQWSYVSTSLIVALGLERPPKA